MTQYLHLLSLSHINLASDLWLPSYNIIKPSSCSDNTIGLSYIFSKVYSFKIDFFYRKYKNLTAYKDGVSFTQNYTDFSEIVTSGIGRSKGIELFIEKSSGLFKGWLSYTYSSSIRQFPDINSNEEFPSLYDRPHNFKITLIRTFGTRLAISGAWIVMSGSMQTMGNYRYISWFDYGSSPYDNVEYMHGGRQDIILYRRNSYRLPLYHRLDLSVTYTVQKKRWKYSWNFGLYNAYNARNAYDMQITLIYSYPVQYKIEKKVLFPVIPFISYQFEF